MTKINFLIAFLMCILLLHQLLSLREAYLSDHPLYHMVIVLDPGHGGKDSGAEGQHTVEKKLTLQTAKQLEKTLSNLGATVYLTRDSDKFVSLKTRAAFAEEKNADLFISIHYNSSPSEEPHGITTFYYHEEDSKLLATTIHYSLVDETKAYDRGVLFGDYLVLRDNSVPSVLLELGFLSNMKEAEEINSSSYQEKLVKGISEGIITYSHEEN